MRAILFVMSAVVALGQANLENVVARVEVRVGIRIVVDVSPPGQNFDTTFPSSSDPGEAWVTPRAVFVPRATIAAMKSGRELAQFLSHAQAHARLDHATKYAEHQQLMRMLEMTPHVPPEIVQRSWELWRLKQEQEAQTLGEQLFAESECGCGKCEAFDELLEEARRK